MWKQPKVVLRGFVHKFLYPLLPEPKVKVVIVASGRSGSNLLVSLLSSHPDIFQYGEVIGDSFMQRGEFRRLLRICGSRRYVRNCFKKRFHKKVVGVKVLYYQFRRYFGEKWGIDDVPDVLKAIRSDKEIKIIHLKRQNALKILASTELAKKTGEYVIREPERKHCNESIELSPEKCVEFFDSHARTRDEFDNYFREHEKMDIYYKDLVQNKETVCRKLLNFLGVRQYPLKGNTIKQSQRPLSEKITNYEELKNHFRNTRWELFFED